MEPFEPKPDFEYPIQKPSFDSVVRQKRREAEQKAEQERYKVANLQVPEEPDNEPLYTEMEQKMMDEARELSLVGHLSELRKRLILMAVAIIVGTCISYYYVDLSLEILLKPAGKLYYMRPTEAFFTYMKVSIVGGLIIAAPIILHQIWLFVKPALTVREKQLSNWILPVAIGLFGIGIVFSYYGIFTWLPSLLIKQGFTIVSSFEYTLAMILAQLPGYLFASWCVEKFGRKITLAGLMIFCALCSYFFGQAGSTAEIFFGAV